MYYLLVLISWTTSDNSSAWACSQSVVGVRSHCFAKYLAMALDWAKVLPSNSMYGSWPNGVSWKDRILKGTETKEWKGKLPQFPLRESNEQQQNWGELGGLYLRNAQGELKNIARNFVFIDVETEMLGFMFISLWLQTISKEGLVLIVIKVLN